MAGYGGSAFILFELLFLLNELVLITAMPPAPPGHTQLFAYGQGIRTPVS